VPLAARRRHGSFLVPATSTGRGIPQSKHVLIFKEFQRLDEPGLEIRGLGLGLSIVERICRVLQMPITIDSRPGHGSTFSVLLPRAKSRRLDATPAPRSQFHGPISGCIVLCIENEPAVLEGMETLLAGWGCNVLSASSSRGAVDKVAQAKLTPDVILADYHLYDETGLEAVVSVRKTLKADIPAIFITSDHAAEVERELRRRGFALLRKPLKAASLRAAMTQLTLRRVAAECPRL